MSPTTAMNEHALIKDQSLLCHNKHSTWRILPTAKGDYMFEEKSESAHSQRLPLPFQHLRPSVYIITLSDKVSKNA